MLLHSDLTTLDLPQTTIKHQKLIFKKSFLRKIYIDFYKVLQKESKSKLNGFLVELGSGGGFIKKVIPEVITSDIIKLQNCDLNFSAEKMPFKDSSVKTFFMLNTFHHIKKPAKARLKKKTR